MKYEEVKELVNNIIKNEYDHIQESREHEFEKRDKEYINDMFKKVNCDVDTKYAKIIKDDFTGKEILAIQMRSVYMEFYKYHKDSNIPGSLLEWKDFQKQLQKSEYYINHNVTVKFSLGVDGKTKDKKCFKLDIDTLRLKGIDIDNILEYAEET